MNDPFSAREEEGRKAEEEVVGQCEGRFRGEGTVSEDVYDQTAWRQMS